MDVSLVNDFERILKQKIILIIKKILTLSGERANTPAVTLLLRSSTSS